MERVLHLSQHATGKVEPYSAARQMKIEKMAQETRVQRAMEEQERKYGKITRTISGELALPAFLPVKPECPLTDLAPGNPACMQAAPACCIAQPNADILLGPQAGSSMALQVWCAALIGHPLIPCAEEGEQAGAAPQPPKTPEERTPKDARDELIMSPWPETDAKFGTSPPDLPRPPAHPH